MAVTAQQRYQENYLFIRREIVAGRNPFDGHGSMKEWLDFLAAAHVNDLVKERQDNMQKRFGTRVERELDWFRQNYSDESEAEK